MTCWNISLFLVESGYKCLLPILDQKMEGLKYKNSFLEKYNALPDSTKKNIIAIDTSVLEIDDNPYFFGFNLSDVALFYKNSKMYIHGCEDEGGSRSIHEAICSGCLVALKKI